MCSLLGQQIMARRKQRKRGHLSFMCERVYIGRYIYQSLWDSVYIFLYVQ